MYCRISKEDEQREENESIQNQKSLLENYCISKGWGIYKIYIDEDYSGIRNDRPAFNEMLVDAANKKFQVVLCKTMSRFSRDMAVVDSYINNKFAEMGIRFISVVDNTDSFDKTNKKTRQINSLINEWYLEDLSENIRAVFKDKMRKGECLFAYAPYGYKKNPEKRNHLIKDEYASLIVWYIYWLYAFGWGTKKIAEILNQNEIASPKNYRENINKSNWTQGTVKDILKNPVYTGNLVQNRKNKLSYKSTKRISVSENEWIISENTHEAIIHKEVYETTKKILSKAPRSEKTGRKNPFSGLFICECGGKCTRKNSKIKCLSCLNNADVKKIENSIVKKIKINTVTPEIKYFVISAVVDKVMLSKNKIIIEWKDLA